jgi:putative hemin transport protein
MQTNLLDAVHEKYATLCDQFQVLRTEKKMRHRDAARTLGISEGEAMAAHIASGHAMQVTRLDGEFSDLIAALKAAGPVMALTRNEAAVHERDGTYLEASVSGHVGLVLGPDIDLRIFYSHWVHGFWVEEASDKGVSRSVQFFDTHGDAVHKIFERSMTDKAAFAGACRLFAAAEQVPGIAVISRDEKAPPKPDSEVNVADFHAAWAQMTDTHQFFGLLRKFGVARTQALRLAGKQFAARTGNDAARFVLQQASERFLEIMIFVPNPGCIQIHTGPVSNIQVMGPWVNVLDPDFNLHLREDLIAESWIVRKPTEDGVVTSLELYDHAGETIAFLFGKRKPGIPELDAWRALVAEIPMDAAQ